MCLRRAVLALLLPLGLLVAGAAGQAQDQFLCFERISTLPALYLQEHPAGGKLVAATQNGVVYLLTMPGVRDTAPASVSSVFLNITARTRFYSEEGLLSFAFHPKFLTNGRFFVSYICDSTKNKDCSAPSPCTASVGCVWPGKRSGVPQPATNLVTIVAEYSAGPAPANAAALVPKEVTKILKFARPYTNHNGGQIWFGSDGFFYYASGDGGNAKDPLKNAQNGKVFLGKILRLDVDNIPAGKPYGIPTGNPFVGVSNILPEIYALGLRNPWRCSEDTVAKTLFCGDVGQSSQEEVDIIVKGGNYGWSYYEGNLIGFRGQPPAMPGFGGSFQSPIFTYSISIAEAVTGGFVYRSSRNPCLQGKYIFNDLYGTMFVAVVYPTNQSTVAAYYTCPKISTNGLPCAVAGSKTNLLWSWGADLSNDLYILSVNGIHRLIDSSYCGFTCTAPSKTK